VVELRGELYGLDEGSHATPSEIAITLALTGAAVPKPREPKTAPSGVAFVDPETFRQRFPDGRIGSDPSLASVEAGERLLDLAVRTVAEDFTSFTAREAGQ
jgi:creatinine amidohydrolase